MRGRQTRSGPGLCLAHFVPCRGWGGGARRQGDGSVDKLLAAHLTLPHRGRGGRRDGQGPVPGVRVIGRGLAHGRGGQRGGGCGVHIGGQKVTDAPLSPHHRLHIGQGLGAGDTLG